MKEAMDGKRYLNFDLALERCPGGYRAKVLDSPSGQASTEFVLPFSELEIENFVLRIGRTRRGVRRLESPEMEAVKAFGGRLFAAVFQGEVLGCLQSSLTEAEREQVGLRLRFRLSEAPELINLPWEYLYNPLVNRFFSLSVDTPIVRYVDLPGRVKPLTIHPPLRILVMISSPHDYAPIDSDQEWAKLKEGVRDLEASGQIVIERLLEPTLTALQRKLRHQEYHIFHFIGHGAFDEEAADGVLLLEDSNRRSRAVSGQYLGMLLHDEKTVRLAVLNMCEGGRTSSLDPFAGVGLSMLQQGIPAVIAMQYEITDKAAIILAHEFYTTLADGCPIDEALAEARKAIFAQHNETEWGTPVLYLRSSDGRIFDLPFLKVEKPQNLPVMQDDTVQTSSAHTTPSPLSIIGADAKRQHLNQHRIFYTGIAILAMIGLVAILVVLLNRDRLNLDGQMIQPSIVPLEQSTTELVEALTPESSQLTPTPLLTITPTTSVLLPNLSGTWFTNIAKLNMVQQEEAVEVTVEGYGELWNYFMDGFIEGNTITFKKTDIMDELTVELSEDGSQFTSLNPSLSFCGVRSGPLPSGCGFSGKWFLRDSSNLLPSDSYAILVQVEATVKGTVHGSDGRVLAVIEGEVHWGKGWRLEGSGGQTIPPFTWSIASNERSFTGNSQEGNIGWDGWRSSPFERDTPVVVFGKVVDSSGQPIEGISIAVTQDTARVDAISGNDGTFFASLPTESTGEWTVSAVGISCTSRIMGLDCNLNGFFEANTSQTITLPQVDEVILVYEKATAVITGQISSAEQMRVEGRRRDGAKSWVTSSPDGYFELPASPDQWVVYVLHNPRREGQPVWVNVTASATPEPITIFPP